MCFGMPRYGEAGELWIVWARLCAVRSGMDWQARRVMDRLCKARQGMAGRVRIGMAGLGVVRLGKAG